MKLIESETESSALDSIIAALIYEQSHGIEFGQIKKNIMNLRKKQKVQIIDQYIRIRKNRRHKPPRAFEMVSYTFDLITNYGMFRDFHRHRALTLERQLLTTKHGYHTPNEIIQLGIQKEFDECMSMTKNVFEK